MKSKLVSVDQVMGPNSVQIYQNCISLIVPVYNEEDCIDPFLEKLRPIILQLQPQIRAEILFVNDGSSDATEELIRRAAQVPS